MPDRHPTRIVLAEDDPASRTLLARQLRKAGYDVIACENGAKALAAIREEVSCIVIADWTMPEMDGLELCRTVRGLSQTQDLSFVYFILLTAHREKAQIVAGLEAGADDYLVKPYHRQELLARLRAGERVYTLQTELMRRQVELHNVNSQLAALNQRLEKLANTDMLTELSNRRHLLERFAEAWALAERNDRPLGCVMFDIDRFKPINDTYGHAAGDKVLAAVARATRRCLRRYDIVGRFGGDEFCVLCPEAAIEGVAASAERIRAAIAGLRCTAGGAVMPVTVSLGVAGRSAGQAGPEALIGLTDKMLYRAKEDGRNRVWVCDADGQEYHFAAMVGAS